MRIDKDKATSLVISRIDVDTERELLTINTNETVPRLKYERMAFIARILGSQASNIIFANGPIEAERIASALEASGIIVPTNEIVAGENDVIETVNSLKTLIHPEYNLVNCLSKGIAYHYGAMPDVARTAVEELFRAGSISYLACTSTLLEGVNLPAKNIFIESPRLGIEQMDDSSFWNLAGRAGRLMKDLSGNVYCINQDTWERPVVERKREYKIESSLTRTLNSSSFLQYCYEITEQPNLASCEQALNSLALRYLTQGRDAVVAFVSNRVERQYRTAIITNMDRIRQFVHLPAQVLRMNKGIDIRLQHKLAEYFQKLSDEELITLAPRKPFTTRSYRVLRSIFSLCDEYLTIRDRGRRFQYFTLLAYRWIREDTLRDLILSEIRYRDKTNSPYDVNEVIRELIEKLEEGVRFHYVKTTKCYCDLMLYEIQKRELNIQGQPNIDFALPNYLELGVFREETLILYNAGLSRTAAIEVGRYCRQNNVEQTQLLDWVKERVQNVSQRMLRPIRTELLRLFQ